MPINGLFRGAKNDGIILPVWIVTPDATIVTFDLTLKRLNIPMSRNPTQPIDAGIMILRIRLIPPVAHEWTSCRSFMISRLTASRSASISARSRGGWYW